LAVVVSGYESGFENFFHPVIMKLKHLPDNHYYDSEFQLEDRVDKDGFEGVVLRRVERGD